MAGPFLDLLPVELRLQIYSYLLVTPVPIKGLLARGNQTYDLQTAILRTNHQIYTDARSVFFGKNTFYITSVPSSTSSTNRNGNGNGGEDGMGAFEPPLQLRDLPLVRHLEVDLLYWPKKARITEGAVLAGWTVCLAAGRYVRSLSYLLSVVQKSLFTLKLCADTRRYVGWSKGENEELETVEEKDILEFADPEEQGEEAANWRKVLTGFQAADLDSNFRNALAELHTEAISVHFDFPDSYFDFEVAKDVLCGRKLGSFAQQVLAAREGILLNAANEETTQDKKEEGPQEEDVVHVSSDISFTWPRRKDAEAAERRMTVLE